MTPFTVGFASELEKLANVIEKPLPATAGYRSDTKHFGAPEPGGPQNAGGHQVGPDGTWRGIEVPGDEPNPIKTAEPTNRQFAGGMLTGAAVGAGAHHLREEVMRRKYRREFSGLEGKERRVREMAKMFPRRERPAIHELGNFFHRLSENVKEISAPGKWHRGAAAMTPAALFGGAAVGGAIQLIRHRDRQEKTANDPIQARRVVRGLKCAIEWPKGTERKYMDKKDPTKVNYKKLMEADYGYIPGTKDADGEQLDVYVGPDLKSDKVFVIRQLKDDGSFDENKVMVGYDTFEAAKKSYLAHMPRKRLGRVTEMSVEHFKKGHLQESKKTFRKAATVAHRGVPRGSKDPAISLFTPRLKKRKLPDGGDYTDCAQCTAADEVADSVSMSASNAESHF